MYQKELELYLHIPFCVRKCAYCDFLSAKGTEGEQEQYVQAMLREIQSYKEETQNYRVKTVFLGGGTPSLLTCSQVERIFDALRNVFQIQKDAEITMEVNPGTVTFEKLICYRNVGVNRLSIGLQSVHDEELKLLGRIHTYEEFLHTWEDARKAGFDNLNIDLISALPGQTLESWEDSIRTVIALKPEHISAYSLILEEGTGFYRQYENGDFDAGKRLALPSEDIECAMGEATVRILEEAGYHRYEISNYARLGRECRHNVGYWERTNYLGIGAGAASLMENVRFNHVRDRKAYIQAAGDRTILEVDKEVLTQEAQMEEFMFLGLRKTAGVSKETFTECFGVAIDAVYGDVIEKLTEEHLLEEENGMIRLSQHGMDISNYVMAEFLL